MHEIIKQWAEKRGIALNIETKQRFVGFAEHIFDANRRFNITGHKTEEEILENLILGSLAPLCDINVPRGTSFVDIGSGAGIPGLAIGIFFKGAKGLLIESSHKKADFIRRTATELGLKNIEVIHDRAENIAGLKEYREAYDWCFARAMSSMFVTCEVGAAFVKIGGLLYVYSNESEADLSDEILDHANIAGLSIASPDDRDQLKIKKEGVLFKKVNSTQDRFPRGYAAIKRDAEALKSGVPVSGKGQ